MELLIKLLEEDLIFEYRVFIAYDLDQMEDIIFLKNYITIKERFSDKGAFNWGSELTAEREHEDGIKKGLINSLKNCGVKNFKWKKEIVQKDGEEHKDLKLLFKKFNQELEAIHYKAIFIDMMDDGYCYYFLISSENYDKTIAQDDIFYGIREYELYLLTKTMNTKLMAYLRKEFKLQLAEMKDFVKQEKILILTGNDRDKIKWKGNEIKKLGGEIEIK
jgi:hypothetical protein